MASTHPSFATLKTIHLFFVAIIIIFAIVAWFVPIAPNIELNNILKFVIIALSSAVFAGSAYRKKTIAKIEKHDSLDIKLSKYQQAVLVHWSTIEGPAIFAGVSFLLTRNTLYVIIMAVFVILLFMFRPDKERVAEELNLDSSEKSQL